jgi:hypothetical protein
MAVVFGHLGPPRRSHGRDPGLAELCELWRALRSALPHSEEATRAFILGGWLIWLEARWDDELSALRGPGESYCDVILRLAAVGHESLTGPDGRALPIRYSSLGDRVRFWTAWIGFAS